MFKLTHRPSPGNILVPFGPRPKPTPTSPATHYGQDYGWGNGWIISAAASGVVKSYEYAGAYGRRLVIDHGDGFETWYCHTERSLVRVGDHVDGGDDIAIIGATGNTVGPHLHFELRFRGYAVDPATYFQTTTTTPAGDDPEEIDMATPEENAAAVIKALRDLQLNDHVDGKKANIFELVERTRKGADPKAVWDYAPVAGGPSAGRYVSHGREVSAAVLAVVQQIATQSGVALTDEEIEQIGRVAGEAARVGLVAELEAALQDDFDTVAASIPEDTIRRLYARLEG
jgi:Peptidase family M23